MQSPLKICLLLVIVVGLIDVAIAGRIRSGSRGRNHISVPSNASLYEGCFYEVMYVLEETVTLSPSCCAVIPNCQPGITKFEGLSEISATVTKLVKCVVALVTLNTSRFKELECCYTVKIPFFCS